MEASEGKGKRSKNFNMWYSFLQPCPCLFCIPHRNQERSSWRYCRRIGRIRNNTEDDAQSYKSAKLKKILKMILLYWVKGEPGIGKKEVVSNDGILEQKNDISVKPDEIPIKSGV